MNTLVDATLDSWERNVINDYLGVSCSERGQCIDGVNDYISTCDPGFTGKNCEMNINECEIKHVDCSGKGQCRDGINSYTCVCDPGFTGSDCEVDVNECEALGVICSGHGRCVDDVNSYLLELEVIGGVFTGVVAFGLILIIVFGILIAIVAKSKRSRKG